MLALQVIPHMKQEQLSSFSLLSIVCFHLVPNLLCCVSIQRQGFAHTKCLQDWVYSEGDERESLFPLILKCSQFRNQNKIFQQ